MKAIKSNNSNSLILIKTNQTVEDTNSKPNNSKLYWGIGLGVCEASLIGVIVYWTFRRKDK